MRASILSGISALILIASGAAAVAQSPACKPTVEGPIPVTATSKIYSRVELPKAGAVEEEFFVSCDVTAGHYKTLIHVRLPKPPVKQSGIVVAEPWHPGNTWSVYSKTSEYDARAGHVAIAIVANPMIIERFIKTADPTRYASLVLPKGAGIKTGSTMQDQTEFEVLGQVGALIKSGGIPGINPRKVILGGMSQTGGVVRGYIGFEHARPGAKSVYDAYFPAQSAKSSYAGPLPDLDVPVVELQGERELMVSIDIGDEQIRYRRPDGAGYRLYEVPAMPHGDTRTHPEEAAESGCTGHTVSNFPNTYVFGAALNELVNWVDKGIPAAHVPRIETSNNGHEVVRDAFGNALGGFRSSYVDVPTATYHALWADYHIDRKSVV